MHGHDSSHEKTDAPKQASVNMMEPAVASVSCFHQARKSVLNCGEVMSRIAEVLVELARTVRAEGGLVGHIKAYVSFSAGGGAWLSVVRDRAEIKEFDLHPQALASAFKTSVTAIVYGCDRDELCLRLNSGLAAGLPDSLFDSVFDNQNIPITPYEGRAETSAKPGSGAI